MTSPAKESYDSATYRSGTHKGVTTGVFSSNMPHRAPLLCYIAGIECPVTSASVSYGVWKIPEARITMFPDPHLQRFGAEDRVPMVLFYLDEYIEPAKPQWRLLFEGEIVGWGYTNAALGRSIHFDCVMDIAMWTQLFLFYMTTVSGLGQGASDAKQDASAVSTAVAQFPYSLFHRGLITAGDTGLITRPFDLAYNTVRALISPLLNPRLRSLPAVNFFTRWVRRNQFHNKWVALPFLDDQHDANLKKIEPQPPGVFPILRAVKSDLAVKTLRDQVAAGYSGAPIYTMLKRILNTVYMELVMLPTAGAVTTRTDGTILGPGATGMKPYADVIAGPEDPTAPFPDQLIRDPAQPLRVANYFVKPQMLFGLPPTCNVIFPSMTPQISYQESYVTQPTRLYLEDDNLAGLVAGAAATPAVKKIITSALSRAYPPEADFKLRNRLDKEPGLSGKNLLIYPEEFFKGPVTSRTSAPPWLMYFAANRQGQGGSDAGIPDQKTVTPEQGKSLTDADVYSLYVQYEFFRQRYEQRGGAVECAFQPYVVPGFPLMVFDDFQSRMHLIGYLMNVTQNFSPGKVGTQLNFSYGRTIYEFFADIAKEIDNPTVPSRKGLATAAAPPEPIPEIRDIIQHEYKADQFYQRLFMGRTAESQNITPKRPAVLRLRDILAFVKSDGTLEDITIEGKNEETIREETVKLTEAHTVLSGLLNNDPLYELRDRFSTEHTTTAESKVISDAIDYVIAHAEGTYDLDMFGTYQEIVANTSLLGNIVGLADRRLNDLLTPKTFHNLASAATRELTPKPGFEPLFDGYDAAMKYCARPICTLDEYIAFIGGSGEGPYDDAAYSTGEPIPSARYYKRIRHLKGAPPDHKVKSVYVGVDPGTAATHAEGIKAQAASKATAETAAKDNVRKTTQTHVVGEAVPEDFPVLRAEWEKSLLAYRRNAYNTARVQR